MDKLAITLQARAEYLSEAPAYGHDAELHKAAAEKIEALSADNKELRATIKMWGEKFEEWNDKEIASHCAHDDCKTEDELIGLGTPPLYYCIKHFDQALKETLAPVDLIDQCFQHFGLKR